MTAITLVDGNSPLSILLSLFNRLQLAERRGRGREDEEGEGRGAEVKGATPRSPGQRTLPLHRLRRQRGRHCHFNGHPTQPRAEGTSGYVRFREACWMQGQ